MGTGQRKVISVVVTVVIIVGATALYVLRKGDLIAILGLACTALGSFFALMASWQPKKSATASDALADQVARRARSQYDLDAKANGLNEQPMRVRWAKAAPDLADRTGAAIESDLLTGDGSEVAEQYNRIPTGRWIVLGEGGAGKSALMLQLMQTLLKARKDDAKGRLPVQFQLSAWDPEQPALQWMASYLSELFPALRLPARTPDSDPDQLMEELIKDRILPVLDGLDEMDASLRVAALSELSEQDRDFPFVLTSRPEAFRQAVEQRGRAVARAAVVELRALELDEVEKHLCDVPGSADADWSELLRGLRPSDPLATVLSTPLMVWLAGVSYAGRPAELASLQTVEEITDRLFDELIPASFAKDRRWRPEDAGRWLTYLASEVERRRLEAAPQADPHGADPHGAAPDRASDLPSDHTPGDPDGPDQDVLAGRIAWWRLADAAEPLVARIAAAAALLTTGGAFGLGIGYIAGRLFGTAIGLVSGICCGLVLGGLIAKRTRRSRLSPTTVELRLGLRLLTVGLLACGFVGLIAGAATWIVNRDFSTVWAIVGFGVPLGAVYGMTAPIDVEHATSPATVLKRDRIFVVAYVLAYGLACGVGGGVLTGDPLFGILLGVVAGLAGGLFNGLPWLVVFTASRKENVDATAGAVAWFRFLLAKLTWLGSPSTLPWRLMTFLEDARAHGVLRQVGATYEFRHRRLSERLAIRAGEAARPDASPGRERSRSAGAPGR